MKTINMLLIIICFTTSNILQAQENDNQSQQKTGTPQEEVIIPLSTYVPIPLNSSSLYFKDTTNVMDKFVDTWIYDDGTYYLQITFIKLEHFEYTNTTPVTYYDELVCEYIFKINGVTKYDTSTLSGNLYDRSPIVGSGIRSENKINLLYTEPPLNGCDRYKYGTLMIEYVAGTTPQLIWTRTNSQLFGPDANCFDGSPKDMSDLLIPANMMLTKQ